MNDNQLRHRFATLRLDEPPPAHTTEEILARGRRRLRRHRFATGATATLGVSAIAVSGAVGGLPDGNGPGFASSPAGPSASPSASPTTSGDFEELYLPETRRRLVDVAVEHFDPQHNHLRYQSVGSGLGVDRSTGEMHVTSRLAWVTSDDRSAGFVDVGVTTPGQNGAEALAYGFGCEDFPADCPPQEVPGSGGLAYVVQTDGGSTLQLAVIYERHDGSAAAVAVHDLFAQFESGEDVGVGMNQALAFVTDDRLTIDRDEHVEGVIDGIADLELHGDTPDR